MRHKVSNHVQNTPTVAPLFALVLLVAVLFLSSVVQAADLSPLRTEGTHFVDRAGVPVILRGCNLGNWFVLEMWMMHFSSVPDQYEMEKTLAERFGEEQKNRWIEQYREGFMQPRDWEQIKSFGMNCIRLPLHYNLLLNDAAPYDLRPEPFKWIDRAVDAAERHGIYVIADLHAAPGSQSVDHTTGRASQNRLWSDPACRAATITFWREMARRYRGRSAIAGFDIFNEPYGDYRSDMSKPILDLAREIYHAVRAEDPNRILFLPGDLRGGVRIYDGEVSDWTQIALTQHHYPGLFGDEPSLRRMAQFLGREMDDLDRLMRKLNRPLLIGEFNGVTYENGGPYNTRLQFDRYAKSGWAATLWSYKILKPEAGPGQGNWYLVTNTAPIPTVDPKTSSREELSAYFAAVGTAPLAADEKLRGLLLAPSPPDFPMVQIAPLPDHAPTSTTIAPWSAADIGDAKAGGQLMPGDGSAKVYAAGNDIFNKSDSFRFVSCAIDGNCEISAVVSSLLESDRYAKAGIMIRANSQPGAAHVMLNLFPDSTVALCWRPANGEQTQERKFHIGQMPIHLKLQRVDDIVTASISPDGVAWEEAGKAKLAGPARIGLAVTSHAPQSLTLATFNHITIQGEAKP